MDKTETVRNYVVNLAETGKLTAGQNLPSARDISGSLKISFNSTVAGLASLSADGLLHAEPKKKAVLREDWQDAVLPESMRLGGWKEYMLPETYSALSGLLEKNIPGIKTLSRFNRGMFELTTTVAAQSGHAEFMDLSEHAGGRASDEEAFFSKAFDACKVGGKLIGIPVIFSPRLILYNPALLKAADCPLPRAGWTAEEFVESIKKLRRIMPPDRVFNWTTGENLWMCFVFRAGGSLLEGDTEREVRIDDPKTKRGISVWTEIKQALGPGHSPPVNSGWMDYHRLFANGEVAFLLAPRNIMYYLRHYKFDGWGAAHLPSIDGGEDATVQGTEILCVRKECVDHALAKKAVDYILSEEFQDAIGALKYGIPVRKSSAVKNVDFNDPRDTLFLTAVSWMKSRYYLDSPELAGLIVRRIKQIWSDNLDSDAVLSGLAETVRAYLRLRGAAPPLE